MKNQKNKTTIKTKQTTTTAKKPKKHTHTHKTKDNKEIHLIFPNDFSHVVYLFLHQSLLSTIYLRY